MIFGGAFALYYFKGAKKVTTKDIQSAEKIVGLRFSGKERKLMLENLRRNIRSYEQIREVMLENHVPPSIQFNPVLPDMIIDKEPIPFTFSANPEIQVPENLQDLAFYPVTDLAQLIRSRKITSVDLTNLYLDRLKKYGPQLECIITLTEELALEQAKKADEEIDAGQYRGPLHGIPWGAKDLLSTKGIRTT